MKTRNRLMSLLLTMAMILTMMVNVVIAATPAKGSITISNATIGKDYSIYKVFDIEESEDGKKIYKIASEEWADLVTGEGKPFEVIDEDAGIVKTDKNDAAIIAFFKTLTPLPAATSTMEDVETMKVTFAELEPGYYYIKSEVGAVASLVNAETITIIDKNQKPSWEPEDPTDPQDPFDPYDPENPTDPDHPGDGQPPLGKFVKEDGQWVKVNDAPIGEELPFMINLYAPKYVGANEVVAYTILDDYGTAFTNVNSVEVYVDKVKLTSGYTKIDGTGFFKIVLNMDKITADLGDSFTMGNVSITYKATLSDKAQDANINTAKMNWTQVPYDPKDPYDTTEVTELKPVDPTDPTKPGDPSDPNTIYTPVDSSEPEDPSNPDKPQREPNPADPTVVPPATSTTTYTYEVELKKEDSAKPDVELTGATFNVTLKDSEDLLSFTYDEDTKTYTLAKASEGTTTDIEAGYVTIKGLDATTYTFYETDAPEGFNGIDEDGVDVEIKSRAKGVQDAAASVEVVVENTRQGSILPTTGGVGTTMFYVIGSILIIGASVVLVSRKRANR